MYFQYYLKSDIQKYEKPCQQTKKLINFKF